MPLLDTSAHSVYIIAATPFTDDGAVDTASLDRLMDFYVRAGITGVTVLGIMGEAPKLTHQEAVALTRQVVRRVNGLPVIVGIWPFDSALHAEFMANEVPGVTVPDALVARMRSAEAGGGAEAEGVAIARELLADLRPMAQGVHVFTLSGTVERAFEVLA